MQTDVKYHGIYRGTVVATNDPSNLGRVTLTVPQVFGTEVTNWAYPILGVPVHSKFPYGNFHASTSQTITSTTTAYNVTIDTDDGSDFIFLDDTVPTNTHIHVKYAGVYNIQFSAQIANTSPSMYNANVWIRVNGVDVPASTGQLTVPGKHGGINGQLISSWNYLNKLNANDYVEFMWQAESTSVFMEVIDAGTTPVTPISPSFAVTFTLAGGYTPLSGDSAWVMFEGGDPNFPLWLGTFTSSATDTPITTLPASNFP
jgi:hypothetical protein